MSLLSVVLILGVLAVMAMAGYQRQLAQAKSSEALSMLGGIKKAVVTSYGVREDATFLLPGQSSGSSTTTGNSGTGATVEHDPREPLCGGAEPVPASIDAVMARKYQSSPNDWRSGSAQSGWRCLGFAIVGSQYYQYGYDRGGAKVKVRLPKGGIPPGLDRDETFTAWARGDLDGDGKLSWLAINGQDLGESVLIAPGVTLQDELE